MRHPLYSLTLVGLQFTLIACLLFTTPWISLFWLGLLVQFSAILLGLWAVKTMHLGRFNIVPDPKKDAKLVQVGPYRWIRHPMYASILLFFLPLMVHYPSFINLPLFALLVITLLFKLSYEEALLSQTFSDYSQYQLKTHRLLPFVY